MQLRRLSQALASQQVQHRLISDGQDERRRGQTVAKARLSVRVASSIGAFTRGRSGTASPAPREANPQDGLQPFRFLRFSERRWRNPAAPCARPAGRATICGWKAPMARLLGAVPCYAEIAQPGRICLRPWLGRRLRARRRALLSQTAGVGAVHARRPARACWSAATPTRPATKAALAAGLKAVADRLGVSSAHVTFAPDDDIEALEAPASCTAPTSSSISSTTAMATYDDFLATLASRKRKALKKERREALADGISHRLADRQRSDRSASGTISSPSTWTPAAANGAGPTSTANSSR